MATSLVDISRALKIDGWMTPDELEWLAVVATQAERILEIGSWCGRSTRALADHTDGVVHCVDQWAGFSGTGKHLPTSDEFEAFKRNLSDHLESGCVVPHRCDSLTAHELFDAPFDMIFLDGCHFYEHVKQEIEIYTPRVRGGGILAGHDYWTPEHVGVTRAVDEAFGRRVRRAAFSIWWVQL